MAGRKTAEASNPVAGDLRLDGVNGRETRPVPRTQPEMLDNCERETQSRLPQSYREFLPVFGARELAHRFNITNPVLMSSGCKNRRD